MYCSRCNGLLLEGFLQIVMYGKSLQQEGAGGHVPCNRQGALKTQNDAGLNVPNGCHDEIQDPSVHPWGGLTTTRDGSLTLMDCYLYAKSLKGLQNVISDTICSIWLLSYSLTILIAYILLDLGFWQCTCKGTGTRVALSWCMWWEWSGLDKPRSCELWQRAWNKGDVCTAHSQAFLWHFGGFLVSSRRRNPAISSTDEGRGFYREAYVQVFYLYAYSLYVKFSLY